LSTTFEILTVKIIFFIKRKFSSDLLLYNDWLQQLLKDKLLLNRNLLFLFFLGFESVDDSFSFLFLLFLNFALLIIIFDMSTAQKKFVVCNQSQNEATAALERVNSKWLHELKAGICEDTKIRTRLGWETHVQLPHIENTTKKIDIFWIKIFFLRAVSEV
jgi:hypothetical protein